MDRSQVHGDAPGALHTFPLYTEGKRKVNREMEYDEDRAGSSSYRKRCSPAPSSHWGRVTLIWEAVNLPPQIHWCVALTIFISTLLFTYPQVHKYASFPFVMRRLAIRLIFASYLTPKRPSTEVTNGV